LIDNKYLDAETRDRRRQQRWIARWRMHHPAA
jgi:hypothetical protein